MVLGLVLGVIALWFAIIVLAILAFIFWILMLVNVATAKNKGDWKVIWILIVVLLGIIGAIIYYFVGKKERKG